MNKITKKDKEFVLNIEQEVNSCIKNSSNIKLYTEEDLEKAIDMAHEKVMTVIGNAKKYSPKEIIQSLQKTKPPVAFDCEMKQKSVNGSIPVNQEWEYEPKTTTNSQGITQWVGSYIYK
jgi:uncharacterized membrane-anchored protein